MPDDRIDASQFFLLQKLKSALLWCIYAFPYYLIKLHQLVASRTIQPSSITPRDLEHMLRDETVDPKPLPLSLLKEITDGFSDEQRIGKGGFAVVYKGKVQNRIVAIKRMSNDRMDERLFHREVQCLMIAKHKNVVRFLGYCADRQGIMEYYQEKLVMADIHQRLLCFEYLPKGSLREYITVTRTSVERLLPNYHWNLPRVTLPSLEKIAHLDLKPENILLDNNLVAKIADFGLSRCFIGETESRVISKIGGTPGYWAPEIVGNHTEVTNRNLHPLDIYSLGVVILEILTGKNCYSVIMEIHTGKKEYYHVVDNVVESRSNMVEKSHTDEQLEQVRVCAEIGIQCTNSNPAKRPDTHRIINRLDGKETMDDYINTGLVTSWKAENAPNEQHQEMPNSPGETSSMVVESSSNRVETTHSDEQLEQVQVCAEIGTERTNFNPAKRTDTQCITNRLDGIQTMDEYIETGLATSQQDEIFPNKQHQGMPNSPGEKSSKENVIAVTVEEGTNLNMLNKTLQSLNLDIRRCIEFCSIFPKGSKLRRDDLVCLWIAQGFVKTSCATEDMEERARWYIQELVSISFLQATRTSSDTDCFTVPDALHHILDKVDAKCFRIENARSNRGRIHQLMFGKVWKGDVPRETQHLLIQHYDGKLITKKIIGLEYLRTLIVYIVGKDKPIEEKVIESICKRLPKLQVLAIAFSQEHDPIEQPKEFSFQESVGQLEHLRYLAFRASGHCKITLPSTINKLRHIQLLDFGNGKIAEFTVAELVNLRHIFCWRHVKLAYVGKLSSLQTLPSFIVSNEQGCELKELRDLNKIQGKLCISGLENVKSKAQALQANLTAKEGLTELSLWWGYNDVTRCSREVQSDVLDGLCSPVGLQKLVLWNFAGCRYPDWMLGKHSGGPKYLQELYLWECSQPVPGSGLAEAFPHLRVLEIWCCSWDDLPGNMEHLTSLKKLEIGSCENIRSLPSLPQFLEEFRLRSCNHEFMKSCQTVGDPNWQKIEHIPNKIFK